MGLSWMYRWVTAILLLLVIPACGTTEEDPGVGVADDPPVGVDAADSRRESPRRPVQQGSLADQMEDARLASRVLVALADDDQLRRYVFEVDAVRGQVYVRGGVPNLALRGRVDDIARSVSGVRTVVNETVSDEIAAEPVPLQESDDELAAEEVEVAEQVPVEAEAPAPSPAPPAAAAPESADVFHTVRSGESLWTIARQHNTSIAEIRRLNNMSSDNLRPGQRIRVR